MVVKMMKWPPWPSIVSTKYEVNIVIHRLEGLNYVQFDREKELGTRKKRMVVEVKWKGRKSIALSPLRRSVKRNFTEEGGLCGDGIVEWNEEFHSICNFSAFKEGVFYPWEVSFTVVNNLNEGPKNKLSFVGTASLNLAEFASIEEKKEVHISIPMTIPSGILTAGCSPSLCLSLRLVKSKTAQEPSRAFLSSKHPIHNNSEDDKGDGWCSVRKDDTECNCPFDTDSVDRESEKSMEDLSLMLFNYETLAHATFVGSFYNSGITDAEGEDWIYYRTHKSDGTASICEQHVSRNSKRKSFTWRKRKLNLSRSTRAKAEPLLRKDCREEGGDDIDYDRRQLSSSDESSSWWYGSEGSSTRRMWFSEFGSDNFAVGRWEHKEVRSRDGRMKLQAQVFFASIDQRSERAAGESACTALVAVIANWLHLNRNEMPIKSEFDSLIREGSLEWRNLCENKAYIDQFPDKHFDLETILQAKIRALCVDPDKSFIGFFNLEGREGENFDFLNDVLSFDGIWDEISHHSWSDYLTNNDSLIYIISWNDHFFVLKIDRDAYYIIDTLGERLYEGCNQAYVLKFDKETTISRLTTEERESQNGNSSEITANESGISLREEEVVCRGKESCREYIKSFLAAIPIGELEADIKKGLMDSTSLHQRLQIEFHYTQMLDSMTKFSAELQIADHAPAMEVE